MIVKVQQSLTTSAAERQMLVYSEDRITVFGQFPATQEVLDILDGRSKVFFHAEVDATGRVTLRKEAPEREW